MGLQSIDKKIKELEGTLRSLQQKPGTKGDVGERGPKGDKGDKGDDGTSVKLKDVVDKIRPEVLSRFSYQQGGGNANRDIQIGGVNALRPYTDINLKAGTGISITYTANNTTRYTDVTIAATGGGSGIIRSVNSISGDTSAGSAAGTDYVYICSGTLTLTLPATIGNSNLYTVKNVGSGVVTIATTGADTIDSSANLVLPLQYTSVDVVSDGISNWSIT